MNESLELIDLIESFVRLTDQKTIAAIALKRLTEDSDATNKTLGAALKWEDMVVHIGGRALLLDGHSVAGRYSIRQVSCITIPEEDPDGDSYSPDEFSVPVPGDPDYES